MKRITLISSDSFESKNVEELLRKNEIAYERLFEDSQDAEPVLFDPEGRFPYRGFKEINNFLRVENALHGRETVSL